MNDIVNNDSGVVEPGRQSFRERKAAQLEAERDADRGPRQRNRQPQPAPASDDGPPGDELESAGASPNELEDDELDPRLTDEYEDDLDYEDAALEDDELPASDYPDSDDEEVNWQKRYEDTKEKLREVTENRSEMEQEHADMMGHHVSLRHDLEDTVREVKSYAETFSGMYRQQISQLEYAFNNGLIEPDKLPQARQQHQQLLAMRNNLQRQLQQAKEQTEQLRSRERERQADVARVRLARTIPGWSREKHMELGNYALSRGFSEEEFSENLDYRFLEILNDSMEYRNAEGTVKRANRKKKPRKPQRAREVQSRSADGRFRKAKKEFNASPNTKGSFAKMKLAELQRERRRR